MDCIDETIVRGYRRILGRDPDPDGHAAYRTLLLGGMTEAQFLDTLLDSGEFAENNPPLCGGTPPPDPPDPPDPPPGGGAIQSLTLTQSKRGFLLNGKPHTFAAHGNVVTAVPGHAWRGDLELQVQHGETYARLWHWLTGDTPPDKAPWKYLGNGKWDLSQWNELYWAEKREVMAACDAAGVCLEVMIFDRGTGGSQADYKAHPFHPDNNVNDLKGELDPGGTGSDFYALKPKTTALQEAYVRKWVEEMRPFRGVIAEVDNEFRGDSIAWPRRMATVVKQADPSRLVSHSSLGHDLDAAYSVPQIDIVCKHFGNEGRDPQVLHDYIARHWAGGKLINIDEFANGEKDAANLKRCCEAITRAGGHFHIEDSDKKADGYGASAAMRALIAKTNPPFFEKGPGQAGPCPKELYRGVSFYNAQHKGDVWIGNTNCSKQNKVGFPVGTRIAFDSTPQAGQNDPVPPGCPVVPTTWSISPSNPMKTEKFGMQSTFTKPGTYSVTAKGAGGAKTLKVKVVA